MTCTTLGDQCVLFDDWHSVRYRGAELVGQIDFRCRVEAEEILWNVQVLSEKTEGNGDIEVRHTSTTLKYEIFGYWIKLCLEQPNLFEAAIPIVFFSSQEKADKAAKLLESGVPIWVGLVIAMIWLLLCALLFSGLRIVAVQPGVCDTLTVQQRTAKVKKTSIIVSTSPFSRWPQTASATWSRSIWVCWSAIPLCLWACVSCR